MRIAFIAPYSQGPTRGNIVTVQRIVHHLKTAGIEPLQIAVDTTSPDEIDYQLSNFSPDLIHAFHAYQTGHAARHHALRLKIPYMITITGSDVHDPAMSQHPDTIEAINKAQAIICFNQSDADVVMNEYRQRIGTVNIVPQGVETLPVFENDVFGVGPEEFVVLLPTAIRPVKQVEFAIKALAPLASTDRTIRLVIAGGVLDQEYASTLYELSCNAPYVTWLGHVPHEQMGSLYMRADVVINCSASESMPNSLMEAMALGRPLLVSNIAGNCSLVTAGKNGCVFTDALDFRRQLLFIKENTDLARSYGEQARQDIHAFHSPSEEAMQYLELYRLALKPD